MTCSEPGGLAYSQGPWRGAVIVLMNATRSPLWWSTSELLYEPWRRQGLPQPKAQILISQLNRA